MITSRFAPYGALVLRVSLGSLFLAHAGLKLFVFTPAGTAHYFASLGLPGAAGYFDIAAELLAGVALIAGFGTQLVALLATPILLGAIALVHARNGFFFDAPHGGWEFPAFWLIALLVQALIGDGAYALGLRPLQRALGRAQVPVAIAAE